MTIDEYLPLEIARLAAGVRAHLEAGDTEAALNILRAKLTLMEQVLNGSGCPPVDPPPSVGDTRWDALLSAALLDVLGPAWPEPQPLAEPWFPMSETGPSRLETEAQTPAVLAHAYIFMRRQGLRWPAPGSAQSPK